MFESVAENRSERALEKASRLFLIVTVFNVISGSVATLLYLSGSFLYGPRQIITIALSAVAAFVTARGIAAQRSWARWAGIVMSVLMLADFPVGTVVAIAALVYLTRAARAGLFHR